MNTERIRVCRVDELEPGERKLIDLDGVSIGVFNIGGELFAIENSCLHQGGPVCKGKVQGALRAEYNEPGERPNEMLSPEDPAISCPWHGWEYDLRSGSHLGHGEYQLKTYPVIMKDDVIYLELTG